METRWVGVYKHEIDPHEFDNRYLAFNGNLCKWLLFLLGQCYLEYT